MAVFLILQSVYWNYANPRFVFIIKSFIMLA